MKKVFEVDGMTCNSCANLIESKLRGKVKSVRASFADGEVKVDFDEDKISEEEVVGLIESDEFSIKGIGKRGEGRNVGDRVGFWFMIGTLLVLAYFVYKWVGGFNVSIPGVGESSGIIILFFVGLLTGFHCISMCGGFVIGYTTKNAAKGHKGLKQHFVYGGAKVVSYAVIGGVFGLIGGVFAFSIGLRAGIAIFAGLFMIAFALSMLGVGFFKKFQFNPKFLSKWTAKTTHGAKGFYKAPFMTGILSGLFIACGPLQALYLYAAGTGSFWIGFFSLASFSLGTLPVLIGFGSLTSVISKDATKRILKIAAILVLILGLIMLNRGLVVLGSDYSFDAIFESVVGGGITGNVVLVGGVQEINMEVDRYGWSPDSFVLKKGVPARWNINVVELTGCNNEIIVRDYGIDVKLKSGLNVVEFTPDEIGTVRWSCWMGMIPGSFIVTDDGSASESEVSAVAASAPAGGGCGGGAGGGSCGSPTCGSTTGGGGCGCGG
jgi:sulfite exporter TauE/SafE/copper chaperone CopZ